MSSAETGRAAESDETGDWWSIEGEFPLDNERGLRGDPLSLPVPNAALRAASSIESLDSWYAIGEAWAHIACHFMPPSPHVVDIGCGCGKMARFLYLHPDLRYTGIDLFKPGIAWCRRAFEHLAGDRFRFEHFDGISEVYNPGGTIRPCDYRLPFDGDSIDMTICASLFTHLLEPDLIHYLEEIHRVSGVGGRALVSIHDQPPAGQRFAGTEGRIDIERGYFLDLAERAGLGCREEIGNVYGQQVYLLERGWKGSRRSEPAAGDAVATAGPRERSRGSESSPGTAPRLELDPTNLLTVPLEDLGAVEDPALAGIAIPRADVGGERLGLSEQFLSEAESYHRSYARGSRVPEILQTALSKIDSLPEEALILDVGAGSGRSVLACLELLPKSRVLATDLSPSLLSILKRQVDAEPRYGERVAMVCLDVATDHYRPEAFDLVVGVAILHHVVEPRATIGAVASALRPGGWAVFVEPFENGGAVLRLAYREILAAAAGGREIDPEARTLLEALVHDHEVRLKLASTPELVPVLDDKWLFTRSFFEESATAAGFERPEIFPSHSVERPFSEQTKLYLERGAGLAPEALGDWAWQILAFYDEALSPELKRDLPVEAVVLLRKPE